MDKLRKFVDDNRESFDDVQLPEGHLNRFEKKLHRRRSSHLLQITLYSLVTAASIALLVLFGLQTDLIDADLFNPEMNMCDNREEFEQLQLYYHMQMNEVLAQMEKITETTDIPGADGLKEASRQVLLASTRFENTILPDLPCGEDGLFAVNQHYQNSLESLNSMLKFIQSSIIKSNK